ncbi:hypothetical protein G9C98_005568 [Cotesia typhae]|uniref:Pyridoxal 5'-phosphate synthase n=1 Tax=Cotesia typhae TaxID=2053667 RepID=A0A8J5R366_9HYME|nr:hypothetical protein G9C98_005568 [Cotesia typhae]
MEAKDQKSGLAFIDLKSNDPVNLYEDWHQEAMKYMKEVYELEPLQCKIRAHLCHQDAKVDWTEMKERHDELLRQAESDPESLVMPEHFVGYKLIPTWFDFYFSKDNFIADRMEFTNVDGVWTNMRIAA